MNWLDYSDKVKIYNLNIYGLKSDNVLFVSIQRSLVRSKAAKASASINDWVFYSDPLPYYLASLSDWYIVLYDYKTDNSNLEFIEDVISYIDKDITVIIAPKGKIVNTYLEYTQSNISPASCIVGEEKGLQNYMAYQVFPEQPPVILPKGQVLILTMGQPLGGRRELLDELSDYTIIEKKKGWENKLNKALNEGKSVIFQAGNETKEVRKDLIERAGSIPVHLFLFTFRGKDRKNEPGVKKYTTYYDVFEAYSNAFEEPTLDEGIEKIHRVN